MAPNPNECVTLQQQQQQQQRHVEETTAQLQNIKLVSSSSDDVSSEDGEHFYDASSEIGSGGHLSDEQPSNGGKSADSGVDVDSKESSEDNDFDLPDKELSEQIVEQVEYYFSDEHILKDAFLLKHARRNRDGFISLKLITSFKKVKHVTKDWRVVAYACRALSKRLEVNEAGTKVRRVAPLPETDETSPSRTVVAIGLSAASANIEAVAEMFTGMGSVALIRILRPGSSIPPDVRQCANRHPDILTSICAVVEFDQAEGARRVLTSSLTLPDGVRLVELAARRSAKSNKTSPNSSRPVTPQPQSENTTPNSHRKRRGPAQQSNGQQQQHHQQQAHNKPADDVDTPRSPFVRRQDLSGQSNSSTPSHSPQTRRHMAINNNSRHQQYQHWTQQQQHIPVRPKSSSCSEVPSQAHSPPSSATGSHSPWVRRRLGLDSNGKAGAGPVVQSAADNRLSMPTNILRMPNGPDGTRGFHFHLNGKPRSASAPEVPQVVSEIRSI